MTEKNLAQIRRYIINGLVATAVHFLVLSFNLEVLHMPSAGMANIIAAIVGITASFLGNRYFVFCHTAENIFRQATNFILLYAFIACIHGFVLLMWSDILHLDYRIGFLIATVFQVILSYIGNRVLVFRHETI